MNKENHKNKSLLENDPLNDLSTVEIDFHELDSDSSNIMSEDTDLLGIDPNCPRQFVEEKTMRSIGALSKGMGLAEKAMRGIDPVWSKHFAAESALRMNSPLWEGIASSQKAMIEIEPAWSRNFAAESAFRRNALWEGIVSSQKAMIEIEPAWSRNFAAESAFRRNGPLWEGIVFSQKAMIEIDPSWSRLVAADEAVRSLGSLTRGMGFAEKAMIGIDPKWSKLFAADETVRSIGALSKGMGLVEKAMRGIDPAWSKQIVSDKNVRVIGSVWTDLVSRDKSIGIEPMSIIKKANVDFTSHLNNLPNHYEYKSEKLKDEELRVSLVSEKAIPELPVDELKDAFGLLDIIKNVTETEMVGFVGHLLRYPMLALDHKVGRIIRNSVKSLAQKRLVKESFYRCRVRNSHELMPWTETEMWEAPNGISSQGRFNTTGSGYLYLSKSQETAILEMKQPAEILIDIMKLTFEAEIKVIDITNSDVALFRYCMFKASNDSAKVKKEYLVSNFLAQCCHIENIHAIKYKSVISPEISNYVFFDYLKEWFRYESSTSVRTKSF